MPSLAVMPMGAGCMCWSRKAGRDHGSIAPPSRAKSGEIPVSDLRRRTQEAKAAAQAAKVSRSSFRMVAEAYVALHEDSWRNDKHRAQWRATLAAYAYPHFSDMAVACSPYCLIDGTRTQPILL